MGSSLVEMAAQNPDKNYLGIEVHTPGVGACIAYAVEKGVTNLRVICHDATEILRDSIADQSLGGLQLFFPDPWHKARHHKRRIVQPHFIDHLLTKLQAGAFIHMATDWQDYAEQMFGGVCSNIRSCVTPLPATTIFHVLIFVRWPSLNNAVNA